MRFLCVLFLSVFLAFPCWAKAQESASLSAAVQKYVRVNSPKVVLEHVRVIDGTGQPPIDDQNVVIERGKITAVQAGANTPPMEGTTVLDLWIYRNAWDCRHAQPSFLCRPSE